MVKYVQQQGNIDSAAVFSPASFFSPYGKSCLFNCLEHPRSIGLRPRLFLSQLTTIYSPNKKGTPSAQVKERLIKQISEG